MKEGGRHSQDSEAARSEESSMNSVGKEKKAEKRLREGRVKQGWMMLVKRKPSLKESLDSLYFASSSSFSSILSSSTQFFGKKTKNPNHQ